MYVPSWVGRRLRELIGRLDELEHFVVKEARRLDALEDSLEKAGGGNSRPRPFVSYTSSNDPRKAQYTMPTFRVGDPAGTLNLVLDDSANSSTSADSTPVWLVDNPSVLSITAAADGMSAQVQAVAAGTASISVQVTDANGTSFTVGPEVFQVSAGEATSGTLTFTPATAPTATTPATGTGSTAATPTSSTAATPTSSTAATPTSSTAATPTSSTGSTGTSSTGSTGTTADPTAPAA